MRAHPVRHTLFPQMPRRCARPSPKRLRTFYFEPLETRTMLAADLRTFDGTNNNLLHPTWGTAGSDLLRVAAAEYGDGVSTPAGATRLNARTISNLLAAQSGDTLNNRELSAFIYAWGQFLDHDLDLTTAANPNEAFSVSIPRGDAQFDPLGTGTQTIPLNRSQFDPATGTSVGNPRQQINSLTAYIDGSQIYGSDAARAAALRTLVGGHLRTSDGNLLPFNTLGLTNDNPLGAAASSLFVAGDARANENVELTAIHTLFLREHNQWADKLATQHPTWTDEQLYQQARRMVIAELQAITYNEFLPALLGHALPAYRGYNAQVNPGIANEFSTAAFRLGHSLLGSDIEFLDNNGNEVHEATELRDDFFDPALVGETGIDPILKYLASDRAQELDTHVVDEVRNFLFGRPGQGGLDLASLNIQRGRDHGLADYNATRVAYGLAPVKSFAEITSDVATQNALRQAYGNVDNIDLWVGALAETHVAGGSVGALLNRILTDQFVRLRDGDRFWYQRDLSRSEQSLVENTQLADIIARNTSTTNLQDDVFFFHGVIAGRVVADSNGNGRADRGENGLAGLSVQLLDADGVLIASTVTARDGSYKFDSLDLGQYQVRVAATSASNAAASQTQDAALTRGGTMNADFAVRTRTPTRPSGDAPRPAGGRFDNVADGRGTTFRPSSGGRGR